MRVGVTLPSFRDDAAAAVVGAIRAEALGLHGVFVFDHLWPLGQPERPALSAWPLLGAVAASTSRVVLGPLVARVGLLPDELLLAAAATLARIAPGRVVAGIGTGDSASAPENAAFGIDYPPAADRRAAMARCADALVAAGLPVWIGGGAPRTVEVAVRTGAALNLWQAAPDTVARYAGRCEVTWAGVLPAEEPALLEHLRALADAGASWAVGVWPPSLEALAGAATVLAGAGRGGSGR